MWRYSPDAILSPCYRIIRAADTRMAICYRRNLVEKDLPYNCQGAAIDENLHELIVCDRLGPRALKTLHKKSPNE